MEIELNSELEQKLTHQAVAQGFESVEAYAADLLTAHAVLTFDPDDRDQFAESLVSLRESDDDIGAGRTRDLREALRDIADRNGLPLRR